MGITLSTAQKDKVPFVEINGKAYHGYFFPNKEHISVITPEDIALAEKLVRDSFMNMRCDLQDKFFYYGYYKTHYDEYFRKYNTYITVIC